MKSSLTFIRIFFLSLCTLFAVAYSFFQPSEVQSYQTVATQLLIGFSFGLAIISLEFLFKKVSFKTLTIAVVGLTLGYLIGEGLIFLIQSTFSSLATSPQISPEIATLAHICTLLIATYLGLVVTQQTAEQIPFLNTPKSISQTNKHLLIDPSLLQDPRIADLATSGLLNGQLLLPRFVINELIDHTDSIDETARTKARHSLEIIKKIENIPGIDLQYSEIDFQDIKETQTKLLRLAKQLDANIFTADTNRIAQSSIEGVRIINIHVLANTFKPLAQLGEYINIKIQRFGKDPRQGVGYLDDGTMVVVNGGADFIGETIRAQMLTVKHTSSGRMIFCNVCDNDAIPELAMSAETQCDNIAKNYFAH